MNTFIDNFGRTVEEQKDGSWQSGGINVGPCTQKQAEQVMAAMAPEGWRHPGVEGVASLDGGTPSLIA